MHYVGQDTSWRARAVEVVSNTSEARRSNFYAFAVSRYRDPVSSELKFRERVLLFETFNDARSWFDEMAASPALNYVAVFRYGNFQTPIMEHSVPSESYPPEQVGNWWPFLLGLPVGGAAGYFLRRWQEPPASRQQVTPLRDVVRPLLPGGGGAPAPGGVPPTVGYPWLDFVGQDYPAADDPWLNSLVGCVPSVGNEPWMNIVGNEPWMDIVGNEPWMNIVGNEMVGCPDGYSVGGPWVEFAPWIGAQVDDAAKRQASANARSLIQAATREAVAAVEAQPDTNYLVWWLLQPTRSQQRGSSVVMVEASPQTEPYSSLQGAMDRVRQLAQQPGVLARAVFDRTSRHWPNPVTWSKSAEPEHDQMIAEYVANRPFTTAVGAWDTTVGAAIDDVRKRAETLAAKRQGDAIGVIHTTKDNLWHVLAFDTPDDADDWLDLATRDQNAFTYAAYFDKLGTSWPRAYIEKIGGYGKEAPGPRPRRSPIVGATRAEIEAYRNRTQQIATAKPGAAVVVVITSDGVEHAQSFRNLDDAIDGLTRVTSLPKSQYAYAGAFEKGTDGTAYVQQEEFGEASAPTPMRTATIPRDRPATTSGDW